MRPMEGHLVSLRDAMRFRWISMRLLKASQLRMRPMWDSLLAQESVSNPNEAYGGPFGIFKGRYEISMDFHEAFESVSTPNEAYEGFSSGSRKRLKSQ